MEDAKTVLARISPYLTSIEAQAQGVLEDINTLKAFLPKWLETSEPARTPKNAHIEGDDVTPHWAMRSRWYSANEHEASIDNPVIELLPGRFSDFPRTEPLFFRLSFEVTTGDINPNRRYNLAWWALERHRNLMALLVYDRERLILRSGIGMRHGNKAKATIPATLLPNTRYTVSISYKEDAGFVDRPRNVRVRISNTELSAFYTLECPAKSYPSTDDLIRQDKKMHLNFGFRAGPEDHPRDAIHSGWKWSRIRIGNE